MKRKVTPEEREILLNNPELVMFEPYRAFKTHRASLLTAVIPPFGAAGLMFMWAYFFPGFIDAHPTLFAAVSTTLLVVAAGFLPITYFILDDSTYKKARENHYAKYLKMLLPKELECNIAHINWVEVQKAEGGWTVDGKEEYFGYCGFVNYFKFEPETDVAFVSGEKFFAYVKRDSRTESFYS
ncbi:MAG: hypothetical protein IKZ42_00890 [Clostridiales bacterium]|nr:hypothetical protein [Clostridiales bacterium]